MNNRTLIMLALAGTLALPVAAQDSSSSQPPVSAPAASQATPATAAPATDMPPATATNKEPLEQRKEGFWGHLNPFARKKYVQRQIEPVRGRLNELDELTAANSRQIKDVDARATEGIRIASAKANEADMHAMDAGNRAQLAAQTAQDANTRLTGVQKAVTNIDQFQSASQLEIRFRPGQRALSKKSKDALDEMATPLKDQKGYIVEVQGFSSGHGQAAIQDSQEMAESVVRYLVLNGTVPVYRIYRLGMGNAPLPPDENGKQKRIYGGRVEISLLKNSLGDLDTNSPTAGLPGAIPPSTVKADTDKGGVRSKPEAQPDKAPAQPQANTPHQ